MADADHIALHDGRRLDIRVTGDPGDPPLVFHHGTPGALTPVRALERAAHARGLRLVTTSRAGYGYSSRAEGRRVVDVVADTAAVLEAIGAHRCLVAGWSGGGPHALACAARLPHAAAVAVIAGVAPYRAGGLDWLAGMGEDNVVEFGLAIEGAEALRPFLDNMLSELQRATVSDILTNLNTLLPDVDRAALTDEFGEDIAASFREGLKVGNHGWLDDDLAFVEDWGFGLDEIAIPISLWAGTEDLMVPFSHAQWLAQHLPAASAHLFPGEGHLSVGLAAIDQILDELVAAGGLG